MKAAILTEFNRPLAIEDVEPLPPGPRDVVVKIDASGVCHSDLTAATGGIPIAPPLILGHEGAGTVLEVGPEVTRVRPGDRVVASFIPACGDCFFCLNGQSNLCELTMTTMLTPHAARRDGTHLMAMTGLGTFAETMTVHEAHLVKIDSELPPDQLALIGCGVTTGVGAALNTARILPGSSVAVIGCGGVGQAVIQGARIAGAARIFAIDPVEMKRKTAETLGATDPIDPAQGDPVEQVRARTGGRGADYAFEVIGHPATILQAYEATRKGGVAVVVGVAPEEAEVSLNAVGLMRTARTLMGTAYGNARPAVDFPRLLDLFRAGRLKLRELISHRFTLDQVNEAFQALQAGEVARGVIVFE